MLLCFVDESFKGDFYGFAAIIADEHATKDLTEALNRIVRQASVDFGVSDKSEIHGYPLFHGEDDWKGVGARARVRVFEQVVEARSASNTSCNAQTASRERTAHTR